MSIYAKKPWLENYPSGMPREVNSKKYSSIADLFESSCETYADLPAYTNLGKTLTFRQLDELSRKFSVFLTQDLGLRPGDRIAIQLPNTLQYPIALFGALRSGLIVVNTNPLYTPREMAHQFKDSGAKAILILANFASKLQEILHETEIEHVVLTELGDLLSFPKNLVVNFAVKHIKKMVPAFHLPQTRRFSEAMGSDLHQFKPATLTSENVAFLQYTGGTTGVAKGAVLTHGNIVANVEQMMAAMETLLEAGKERVATPLPLYHIFSLTVNCMGFLKIGSENILITNPKDLESFEKDLEKYRPTVLTGVNTLFNALANRESFKKMDHSQLKISVGGGMAVQRAVSDRWKEITGNAICEGYGLTESSPVLSVNPLDGTGKIGSIGLPVPNTEIKIVDDAGDEVPLGEPGELLAKGPQIMKEYWNRPQATSDVLADGGWLKTGDVAVMDSEGYFRIVDRKKEMILVSGFNVYPNEIEDVLAKHPKVLEVACIGVPDDQSGEAVKVFVVPREKGLTEGELRDFCKEHFTGYKKPKYFEFREDLPKTNVGKVLRRVLREQEGTGQA